MVLAYTASIHWLGISESHIRQQKNVVNVYVWAWRGGFVFVFHIHQTWPEVS